MKKLLLILSAIGIITFAITQQPQLTRGGGGGLVSGSSINVFNVTNLNVYQAYISNFYATNIYAEIEYLTSQYITNSYVISGKNNTLFVSNTFTLYPAGPGKLLRTDSNTNVVAATIGSGLTWDGTTLSASALGSSGSAYIIVGGSATPSANWTSLTNAYSAAKSATPHGSALAANNRYTIFLLPGVYDLGSGTFNLDTQFIDLVGISPNSGQRDFAAVPTTDFGETIIKSSGDVVKIDINANTHDIALVNLCLYSSHATSASVLTTSFTGFGTALKVYNCLLTGENGNSHAMPWDKNVDGLWVDVRCYSGRAFGKAVISTLTVNGTFIRCIMAPGSMAGGEGGTTLTISGKLIDCITTGASSSVGASGDTISGTIIRLTAAAGGGFLNGTISSTAVIVGCNAGAGSSYGSGAMAGRVINCTGTASINWSSVTGTISGNGLAGYTENAFASRAVDAAVNIATTGWTNTFAKNATVYIDGTGLTYTVYNNAGTSIYTNAATVTHGEVHLQPSGKVIITAGTGVTGRAVPF